MTKHSFTKLFIKNFKSFNIHLFNYIVIINTSVNYLKIIQCMKIDNYCNHEISNELNKL